MDIVLDLEEVKRYLKYDNSRLDTVTKDNIDKAIKIVKDVSYPKYLVKKYPITIIDKKVIVDSSPVNFSSDDLVQHLENCDSILVVVATLGLELDYQIKKLEIMDLGLAYAVNAVAVEYLEKYLDYIQLNEINTDKNMTSRFSIGYGDLELENQSKLIKLVDASKSIGVNVLESHLMVPSKSVSAIIGLSDLDVNSSLKKCDNCTSNGKCSGLCIGKVD